jgi:hypothetical protein
MKQGFIPGVGSLHLIAFTPQQQGNHLSAHSVIIHHENPARYCVDAHQRKDYQLIGLSTTPLVMAVQ